MAAALAVAMLGGWGIAWKLGRRHPVDADDTSGARFVDGSMALLGLLLGFTFAMALSKHDQRRDMVVIEANSIGDFATCVAMLKEPARDQLRPVLREYVQLRLRMGDIRLADPEMNVAIQKTDQLHQRLTGIVSQSIDSGTPIAVPLVNTLNALVSADAARMAALRDRLSAAVLMLLFGAAVISTCLVGRYHGARQKPHVFETVSYIVLVSFAVCVILDLNQPSRGLIRVDDWPLHRLTASMAE